MEPGRPVRPDITVCLFGAPRTGVRPVQRRMEAITDDSRSGNRLRRLGSPDADRCPLVGKAHRAAVDTGAHEGLTPSTVQGPGFAELLRRTLKKEPCTPKDARHRELWTLDPGPWTITDRSNSRSS